MEDNRGVWYNERTHHAPDMPKVDAEGRKIVRIIGDMHEQGFRWGYADSPLMSGEEIDPDHLEAIGTSPVDLKVKGEFDAAVAAEVQRRLAAIASGATPSEATIVEAGSHNGGGQSEFPPANPSGQAALTPPNGSTAAAMAATGFPGFPGAPQPDVSSTAAPGKAGNKGSVQKS